MSFIIFTTPLREVAVTEVSTDITEVRSLVEYGPDLRPASVEMPCPRVMVRAWGAPGSAPRVSRRRRVAQGFVACQNLNWDSYIAVSALDFGAVTQIFVTIGLAENRDVLDLINRNITDVEIKVFGVQ